MKFTKVMMVAVFVGGRKRVKGRYWKCKEIRCWSSWAQENSRCDVLHLLSVVSGLFYIPTKHPRVLTFAESHRLQFCFSLLLVYNDGLSF